MERVEGMRAEQARQQRPFTGRHAKEAEALANYLGRLLTLSYMCGKRFLIMNSMSRYFTVGGFFSLLGAFSFFCSRADDTFDNDTMD
jgi:hypothetical protein